MWLLLVALLCLAGSEAKRPACFRPDELQDDQVPVQFRSWTSWWKRHDSMQMLPFLESAQSSQPHPRRHHGHGCPNLKVQDVQTSEVQKRSISPWEYHIDEDADRYPRRLAFARCLCKGCIDAKTGRETTSLNSVQVVQSMMVLRRKSCRHNDNVDGFYFEEEYISVPVACTCVLPRYRS